MLSCGLLLGCCALLCWPDGRAAHRVRWCAPRCGHSRKPRSRAWRAAPLVLAPLVLIAALRTVGVVGACGCAVLLAAIWKQYDEQVRTKSGFVARRKLAEALRTLVAELRAGAHPAVAAESAAAETDPETGLALRTVAATARLGGEPEAVVPRRGPRAAADSVGQVARSWALAQRHGLPFADVLEALRRDVDGSARFAANAHAGMAGPRASAVVLAGLPAAGLALGQAMGAEPLSVLTATSTGRFLFGLGCVLIAVGLLWSSRITRSGMRL